MKLAVLGAGTFGTAIANSLKNIHDIMLYTRNQSVVDDINNNRRNTAYFANKVLSKHISASTSVEKVVRDADIIFLCLPSRLIVETMKSVKSVLKPEAVVLNGAKGFGDGSTLIPDALQALLPNRIASFKGPSFANEMIFELPTSFTIAAKEKADFELITQVFRKELIVLDYSDNIKGIELLSIIKNVYAIVLGVLDATFNSANVRFMAFTKACKELVRLLKMWQLPESLIFHYAGIGDLGLTALNDLSRNRTLGLLIGKGFWKNTEGNQDGATVLLEGINSLKRINGLIEEANKDHFPILTHLMDLLNAKITVRDFVSKFIYTV